MDACIQVGSGCRSSTLSRRRRAAVTVSAFLTVLLHVVILPLLIQMLLLHPLPTTTAPRSITKKPDAPDDRPDLQYTLVPQDKKDEIIDPRTADAFASRNRLAREENPRSDLAKGGPYAEKGESFMPLQPAITSVARKPLSAPNPRTPPAAQTNQSQSPRQRFADLRQQENTMREEFSESNSGTQVKDDRRQESPPLPPAPDKKSNANTSKPSVRDLRSSSASSGDAPKRNTKTSARLAGERSVQLLRARWGPYMDQVAKKIDRAWNAELSAARRSYRHGEIMLRFGIADDGSLSTVTVAHAPEEMVAEKDLCLRTIRHAAPFPKLTAEMQKEPLLKDIPVMFIFRR